MSKIGGFFLRSGTSFVLVGPTTNTVRFHGYCVSGLGLVNGSKDTGFGCDLIWFLTLLPHQSVLACSGLGAVRVQ